MEVTPAVVVPVEVTVEPLVAPESAPVARGYGSVELMVIGLLAALLVVLAVPVIRFDDENQALKTIEALPTTITDTDTSL